MDNQIDTVVVRKRGMILNGATHAFETKVPMSEALFEQMGPQGLGWVDRAEPAAKTKPAKADKAALSAQPDATAE